MIQHAVKNSNDQPITCVYDQVLASSTFPSLGIQPISNLKIYIDNESGKTRKLLHLNSCSLTSLEKTALVGLHEFTGNEYVSSFLRKGEPLCWKQASANPIFSEIFTKLGTEYRVSGELFGVFKKYVCFLCGQKKIEKVNEARSAVFWRKMNQEHKVADVSLLPPCSDSLRKDAARTNYLARIWRRACYAIMAMEDPQFHGWLRSLATDWIDKVYPDDVSELLVERNVENDGQCDEKNACCFSLGGE